METNARTLSADDRMDILELYARHNHAIDGGDVETLIALFTADGGFVQPGSGRLYAGRDELRKFFLRRTARSDVRNYVHWTGNVMITPSAAGADVRSYGMLVENTADGHRIRNASLKIDELRQEGGQWRFHLRRAEPWPAGQSGASTVKAGS